LKGLYIAFLCYIR